MEFTIRCPIDGEVDVEIEDIRSVVVREPERADIKFSCPHCGTEIMVTAIVPAFLLTAIEAIAAEGAYHPVGAIIVSRADGSDSETQQVRFDDPTAEAYCEYFRRQLAQVQTVDDALGEMDPARPTP